MRLREILDLRWVDVDLDNRIITLSETKGGELAQIPINSALVETFQELKRYGRVQWVFTRPGRRKIWDVRKSFWAALDEAGIGRDFRFHDLRHTFGSHLAMAGVPILTIKELMRHKKIEMTLRYAHLSPSHKEKAVEILAQKYKNGD